MKIGVFQGPAGSVDALAALETAAERAATAGARLLILPELFLTGYNIGAPALRRLAEPMHGPSAARASAIAKRLNIGLLYGYPERGEDGSLYNAALLLGPDGTRRANFRKIHLFGAMEKEAFTPGTDPLVMAEIDGLTIGILICYDVEFPEMVRGLALHGADLVAVPTAQMHPYGFVADMLIRTRAYENQLFVAYANRTGREGNLEYVGHSSIAGPDGSELARAGLGEELIMATLDPELRADWKRLNGFLLDRQPHLYGALVAPAA